MIKVAGSGCSIVIPNARIAFTVHAIVARQKSAKRAHPVGGGRGRNNHRAMRNALVARDRDFEIDSRRPFYAQLHRRDLNSLMFMPHRRIERVCCGNPVFTMPHRRDWDHSLYGTRKILSV